MPWHISAHMLPFYVKYLKVILRLSDSCLYSPTVQYKYPGYSWVICKASWLPRKCNPVTITFCTPRTQKEHKHYRVL